MDPINELRTAIIDGKDALVEKLIIDFKNIGVNISKEIDRAKKLSKLRGGVWTKIHEIMVQQMLVK